jgi:hypothetical protein
MKLPPMRAHQIVPAAVLLLTSGVASAGVTLTYERKKADGETGTASMIFDNGHIRMEGMGGGGGPRGGGGRGAVIVDATAKKVIMLDSEKKTYHEMTEADAKQMKERMEGMRAQMAEQLKNMPPEHRKQAEQAMNRMGGGGPQIEVKYEPLGTKKKVNGFACEMYKVQVGTFSTSESCIAPWSSSLITKAEVDQFRKSFAEMEKAFGSLGNMRAGDLSKAPGIPVEQTHLGPDGKPDWTTTLKSVSRGSVPASQFQVPAGFTKEEMPTMGGRGPGGHGPHGGGPGGPGGPP